MKNDVKNFVEEIFSDIEKDYVDVLNQDKVDLSLEKLAKDIEKGIKGKELDKSVSDMVNKLIEGEAIEVLDNNLKPYLKHIIKQEFIKSNNPDVRNKNYVYDNIVDSMELDKLESKQRVLISNVSGNMEVAFCLDKKHTKVLSDIVKKEFEKISKLSEEDGKEVTEDDGTDEYIKRDYVGSISNEINPKQTLQEALMTPEANRLNNKDTHDRLSRLEKVFSDDSQKFSGNTFKVSFTKDLKVGNTFSTKYLTVILPYKTFFFNPNVIIVSDTKTKQVISKMVVPKGESQIYYMEQVLQNSLQGILYKNHKGNQGLGKDYKLLANKFNRAYNRKLKA